jgi:hypothetical protein
VTTLVQTVLVRAAANRAALVRRQQSAKIVSTTVAKATAKS